MVNLLRESPALARIKAGQLATRAQSLADTLHSKSPMLFRVLMILAALALFTGEAMAKNRPWAI